MIELAIVLVIIGLLVAGVLKGRELITSAKVKNVINQAKSIEAAIHSYQDKYHYRPGDDPKGDRWPTGIATAPSTGEFPGTGATPNNLALAGFITGNYPAVAANMTHKLGGTVIVRTIPTTGTPVMGKFDYIEFANLPGDLAKAMDEEMDDGLFDAGSVRGSAAYTTASVTLSYYY